MVKNKNQLTLIMVDIEFLTIKRRRALLTQNPLDEQNIVDEQNIANQLRDKQNAKEAIEENIRILEELKLEELKEKYAPKLAA